MQRVQFAVAGLTPGYFALVMGSGIISAGLRLQGYDALSAILLWCAVVGYVVLIILTVWRLVSYPSRIVEDFTDPRRGFGFFTFVAGTNVVAVRLLMDDRTAISIGLQAVAAVTWLILGYVIPWTAVLSRTERPVVAAANGTWFIWVVASQSVAVASASLEPHVSVGRIPLALLSVLTWSVGIFMYAAAGIFVSLRMMLYPLSPVDLNPPYFVAMGACAITVLAGARIVEMADTPMVTAVRGLVAGVSVVFWVFATWLIPVLLAAGYWRHWVKKVPLMYEATLWSIVFPLGMYAVAGIYLGRADQLPLVGRIGAVELWFAFAVWALVGVAMIVHIVRTVFQRPTGTPTTPVPAPVVGR